MQVDYVDSGAVLRDEANRLIHQFGPVAWAELLTMLQDQLPEALIAEVRKTRTLRFHRKTLAASVIN
jgi:hypothetical protein